MMFPSDRSETRPSVLDGIVLYVCLGLVATLFFALISWSLPYVAYRFVIGGLDIAAILVVLIAGSVLVAFRIRKTSYPLARKALVCALAFLASSWTVDYLQTRAYEDLSKGRVGSDFRGSLSVHQALASIQVALALKDSRSELRIEDLRSIATAEQVDVQWSTGETVDQILDRMRQQVRMSDIAVSTEGNPASFGPAHGIIYRVEITDRSRR